MRTDKLDVFFQDDERASGMIVSGDNNRIPWTAIKSGEKTWYIVLHGNIETGDASLLRLFVNAIQDQLTLAKAA